MEEDGEGVNLNGAEEGVDGAEAELIPAGEAGDEGSENGQPAEGRAGAGGRDERLGQHDEDAGQGKDDLRQQSKDVGRHFYRAPFVEADAWVMLSAVSGLREPLCEEASKLTV